MNPSIDRIAASDGSGNASLMTVQSIRSAAATTIVTNTVLGVNTNFFASMGEPHTFTDPVTGEIITIISEATAVDFAGHVDSGKLEIDAIAPGYTDLGSKVGDIVIIRPTTQWADNIHAVVQKEHDDRVNFEKEALSDFIAGGTGTPTNTLLSAAISNIVYYIGGTRYTKASIPGTTLVANKDNYLSINITGIVTNTNVMIGAAQPALPANSVWVAKMTTNGTTVVANGITPLSRGSVGTVNIVGGAVTPDKRSGGFRVGITPSLSALGSKVITGLGFKPKYVEFTLQIGAAAGNMNTALGWSDGVNCNSISNSSAGASSYQFFSGSTVRYVNSGGSGICTFVVSSFDEDGFTLNVTEANAPTAWLYRAFG